MTYDQQRADVALNELNSGTPYIPVADIRWVEKVTDFNMQIIPKEKIMLGVATYGKEWELSVTPNNFGRYTSQWSVTNDYAKDFADDIDIEPYRNNAGELSFTYFPDNSPFGRLAGGYTVPRGTPEANKAALQALAYANATGNMAIVNVVWWSDAEAIKSKADLADRLGLRGISIFKIDGTEDDELWDDLSN
jgi:spore germination protein YaaH